MEEEIHCPLLNNRSHQCWDVVWTSLLWENVTADEELCSQSAFGYAWCSVAEKKQNNHQPAAGQVHASHFIGFGELPGSSAEGFPL